MKLSINNQAAAPATQITTFIVRESELCLAQKLKLRNIKFISASTLQTLL
jgi:hypothetical protein